MKLYNKLVLKKFTNKTKCTDFKGVIPPPRSGHICMMSRKKGH